jgi:eukaryotic-like serine/threonine-protein kinase
LPVFKFLTRQHFIVNLLAAIALVALLIYLFLLSLGFITHHGEYDKVPSVKGKSLSQAEQILTDKGFKVQVQDSLYFDTLPPLSVLKQSPEGEMMVKANRVIYLTVNRSSPPLVEIPNMVGFSFRNAEMNLKQLGLKLGDTTRKPDIAKDAVMEQLYQGHNITAGTKIFMGSTISFVLGSGLGEEEFKVPNIVGMTFEEAKATLAGMNLNVGALVAPGISDTPHAYVTKQYPPIKTEKDELGRFQINMIREGQGIDLWLGREPVNSEEEEENTGDDKPKRKKPKDDE